MEMSRFLDLIKKETGKEIKPFDAVFHKDYAKFRHIPYAPPEGQDNNDRNPCIREMTWINVILHEGMTDSLRKTLFPHKFDLGNTSLPQKKTVKILALLEDLNNKTDIDYKWTSESIYYQDLKTVKEGLKNIFGHNFSNTKKYPIKTLKVIKLLQKVKKRKSHLFGLIKPPHKFKKPNLDFRDDVPTPTTENDSLLIADLISYLSIEIPKDKLEIIHTRTLSSSKLIEVAGIKLQSIVRMIKDHYKNNDELISKIYDEMSLKIDNHVIKKNKNTNPLDEALYIYLITLELQHFANSHKKLMDHTKKEYQILSIMREIDDFCITLSKEHKNKIEHNTKFISVKSFIDLANNHKNRIWNLVKLATNIETRSSLKDDFIIHAQKILSAYNHHSFDGKNLENKILSILDCIAAICTVVLENKHPTKYEPYIFGSGSKAKNPLFYFDKEKSIEELIETDFIPNSINQIMYKSFTDVYLSLIENTDKARQPFMNLENSFLKKFTECIQQGNVFDSMASERNFDSFIMSMVFEYIPQTQNNICNFISMFIFGNFTHGNND